MSDVRMNKIDITEDIKKHDRKQKRFYARLKSSKGITCTEIVGPNILLCNVGQATGLTKEIILKSIERFPHMATPKLVLEKGETYSFLCFKNSEDASLFYETFRYTKFEENGTPVYMSYIEKVPSDETVCHHDDPKGLFILNNFITEEEELNLTKIFDWSEDTESSLLKNRQVRHYGYEFRYGSNDVDLTSPLVDKIPNICDILWQRLKVQGYDLGVPDQLTVNKYAPGQGIPSHVDRHSPFGDTILSLSLGSSVVMDWRHHSGKHVPIVVPARSMLVMQDEARYDWQHGIQSRTWDPIIEHRKLISGSDHKDVKVLTSDTVTRNIRISLTFRWTRNGPCSCNYKTLCDSVEKSNDINDDVASNLEDLHVHQVYEQIAGHFSTTRHKPWPKVVEFMRQVEPGAIVLDLGCGNGKNILKRNDILQIAGERSSGLLAECKLRQVCDITADCVRLDLLCPGIRERCADIVICIAVIHHFSNQARRLNAISSISSLLRDGGKALITVWAKDQTQSNYLCKNRTNTNETHITVGGLNLPVHENRTQFQHTDLLVPWKLRNIKDNKLNESQDTLLRYYHVFERGELEDLCEEVPELSVENSFYEEGNWCVVCRKNKT